MKSGNKTGNCSKEFLLDCLAQYMLDNWDLKARRDYLKKQRAGFREELQVRLINVHSKQRKNKAHEL